MASKLHPFNCNKSTERKADVIFLHGLWGNWTKTWAHNKKEPNDSWPYWLIQDFGNDCCIWSLDYPASPTSLSLSERARDVLDLFSNNRIGERPILFICHSLGGLVAKELFFQAQHHQDARVRAIFDNTCTVLFLATPHQGARLASILSAVRKVSHPLVVIDDLKRGEEKLDQLLGWYHQNSISIGIKTVTYYEGKKTKWRFFPFIKVIVVDKESSNPYAGEPPKIRENDDHISIAKPSDKENIVYKASCNLLKEHVIPTEPKQSTPISELPGLSDTDDGFPSIPKPGVELIGRKKELQEVIEAISSNTFVTIKGTGGVGKTRLALEVINSQEIKQVFNQRIIWIELDKAKDTREEILVAINNSLGFAESDTDHEDQLIQFLLDKKVLLVFDTCEGVLNGINQLWSKLRMQAIGLCVLATSQKPIDIQEEKIISLDPMPKPAQNDTASESIALFEYYAKRKSGNFSITNKNIGKLIDILDFTDGLPLAIILLAARLKTISLDRIQEELRNNPLAAAASSQSQDHRHDKLDLCFNWSFRLLSSDVQSLFSYLSLFIAPFTYGQAKSIARGTTYFPGPLSDFDEEKAGEVLEELVDASLVGFDSERYSILKPLRAYGEEKLQKHAKDARKVFIYCFCELNSRNELETLHDKENMYQAGIYAIDSNLTKPIFNYLWRNIDEWLNRTGRWTERRDFNKNLLALLNRYHIDNPGRSWVGIHYAESLGKLGEPIEKVIEEYERVYIPTGWPPHDRIETELARKLSALYSQTRQKDKAFTILNERIEHVYSRKSRAALYDQLGQLYLDIHNPEDASKQFEKASRLRGEEDQANSWMNRGDVFLQKRDNEEASKAYRKAYELFEEEGRTRDAFLALSKEAKALSFILDPFQIEKKYLDLIEQRRIKEGEREAALTEEEFAAHLRRTNNFAKAESHIRHACATLKEYGDKKALPRSLNTAARIFELRGKWSNAEEAYKESLSILRDRGDQDQVIVFDRLAQFYDAQGNLSRACEYLNQGMEAAQNGRPLDRTRIIQSAVFMSIWHGSFREGEELLLEAISEFSRLGKTYKHYQEQLSGLQQGVHYFTKSQGKRNIEWTNKNYRIAQYAIRQLGNFLHSAGNQKTLADKYHQLTERLGYKSVLAAISRNGEGSAWRHVPGALEQAQACHEQSLKFFTDINLEAGIADSLYKLGKVWFVRAKLERDQQDTGNAYSGNIGNDMNGIFRFLKHYRLIFGNRRRNRQVARIANKAISYQKKSIVIRRKIDDDVGLALSLLALSKVEEIFGNIKENFEALMELKKIGQSIDSKGTIQFQNPKKFVQGKVSKATKVFLRKHPEFEERLDGPV
uniref:Predicted ATPase n=1 Tax=Candidatus Kentrum sp. LFY TaxID=2126342 RepID=A0A450WRQ1_9GAMM|nr:MAG: Predicted ATPase [Candidatus Kentron sp. LFY]